MDVVSHFGLSQDPFRTPEPGSLAGDRLTPDAARAYLAGRIAGAGGPDLFSATALDLLVGAASGDPDLLRRLGGSALFHAAFEGARRVEDQHARQAVATQRLPEPRAMPVTPAPVAASASGAALAADPVLADPVAVHRRWWRRTPPITRLAIIVGLLLLSLPIVGYIIGAVKDSQTSGSSYLPEDSIVDAERVEPAETDVAVPTNPDVEPARPASPPARPSPSAARVPAERRAPAEPVVEEPTDIAPEPVPLPPAEPAPPEETAPMPDVAPTVPDEPTPQG